MLPPAVNEDESNPTRTAAPPEGGDQDLGGMRGVARGGNGRHTKGPSVPFPFGSQLLVSRDADC